MAFRKISTSNLNSTETSFDDSLIILNKQGTIRDIGFLGAIGLNQYAGLVRDSETSEFMLIDRVTLSNQTINDVNALDASIVKGNFTVGTLTADTIVASNMPVAYTDTDARNAISASGNIQYNSTTGVISYTDSSYANKVGYNLADETDASSIVLNPGNASTPATYRGDVVDNGGNTVVDISSSNATFIGGLTGNVYGAVYNRTGDTIIIEDDATPSPVVHAELDGNVTGNISSSGASSFTGTVDFSSATVTGLSDIDLSSVSESIIPETGSTYDLGTVSNRWRDLYLDGNTMYLGDTKVSRNASGDIEIKDRTTNQHKKIKVSEIELDDSAANSTHTTIMKKSASGKLVQFTKNRASGALVEIIENNASAESLDTAVNTLQSSITSVESAASTDATTKATAAQSAAAADATAKANAAQAAAIAAAESKDIVRATAASTDATNKANAAQAAAISAAESKDVARAMAASTDATNKANAAQSAAITAAATDATTKANAAQSAATAAAASDATTKANAAQAAAQTFATNAVNGIISNAPAAYDTLSEIQNAMATDTELATAIANISNVPSASRLQTARTLSLTGGAAGSVSFDGSTNANINVTITDGAGSGLDADLLDGQQGSYYAPANHNHSYLPLSGGVMTGAIEMVEDHFINRSFTMIDNATQAYILLCANAGGNDVNGSITMDRTSGLRHACQVDIVVSAGGSATPVGTVSSHGTAGTSAPSYRLVSCVYNSVSHVALEITNPDGYYSTSGAYFTGRIKSTSSELVCVAASSVSSVTLFSSNGSHEIDGNKVWHAGNDGSGSGLDADLLDGQHSSAFATSGHGHTGLSSGAWNGIKSVTPYGYIDFGPANTTWAHIYTDRPAFYMNKDIYVLNQKVYHTGNDGSGSGLDADLLDGQQGSAFATLAGSNSFSNGYNEFGNGIGSVSNDGGWNARVNIAGSSHARLDVKSVSDGIITSMFSHTGHGAGKVGTYSNHPLSFVINGSSKATLNTSGSLSTTSQGTLWGSSNDGSGSGLDADLLDGQHGSYYATASAVNAAQSTANSKVANTEYRNFGNITISSSVTTTALLITDLTNKGFFNQSHSVGKCSWSYAGNGDLTDTGFGTFELAGCVVETFSEGVNKHVRITRPNTGGDGPSVLVYNDQSNGTYSPGWREMVTTYGSVTNITGQIRATGEITAYYSDERLKNFSGKIENALDKVCSLTGYHYTGNETAGELGYDTDVAQVGVSAQEVEAVLPEVVKSAPINDRHDTDYKTVQYDRMIPLLIEAIKELKEENSELRSIVNKLK